MNQNFIDIETFVRLSGKSLSTLRRHLKKMSENEKNTYTRRIPIVVGGGEKILISKDYLKTFKEAHTTPTYSELGVNQHEQSVNQSELGMNESAVNQHEPPLTAQTSTIQEQINEPEYDEIKNGSSQRDDSSIVEILRGQIEYLQRQSETKDSQINELLERLKESQYNLASMQKQLPTTQIDTPKWWQFWK